MKIIFKVRKRTQVLAVKQLELNEADLNGLELPPSAYSLDMETSIELVPGKKYSAVSLVDESPTTVTVWLNYTLCIPNFPKEKIRIVK